MFIFGLFVVLVLVGLGLVISSRKARSEMRSSDSVMSQKTGLWLGGVAAILVGIVILFAGGYSPVANRSLGLPVSFGKVGAALNPGFHWEWPWVSIAEISKTVHTIQFGQSVVTVSPAPGNISGPCVNVRIGGQQTACLSLTVAYSVTDAGAPVLYQDYNGQGDIMNTIARNLVVREEERVVNNVLGDYNPLLDVTLTNGAATSQFTGFGPAIQRDLQAALGGLIDVRSVLILPPAYSALTEANLQRVQYQYGQTIIAREEILTNQAQAQANAAIASSLAKNPGVLVFQCLNIAQQALKEGQAVQPGFCFGGNFQVNAGK